MTKTSHLQPLFLTQADTHGRFQHTHTQQLSLRQDRVHSHAYQTWGCGFETMENRAVADPALSMHVWTSCRAVPHLGTAKIFLGQERPGISWLALWPTANLGGEAAQ